MRIEDLILVPYLVFAEKSLPVLSRFCSIIKYVSLFSSFRMESPFFPVLERNFPLFPVL